MNRVVRETCDKPKGLTIYERLFKLLSADMDPEDYDVNFVVGPEKRVVKGVRIVLKASSPGFRRKFQNGWRSTVENSGDEEDKSGSGVMKILLPEVDAEAFEVFIKLIMTNEWSQSHLQGLKLSPNVLFNLISLCRRFEVVDGFPILDQIAEEFIRDFPSSCLDPEKFVQLSHENLKILFSSDSITITEAAVFEFCFIWASNQCLDRDIDANGSNIREVLGDILFEIRFPTMTNEQFGRAAQFEDLFTPKEGFAIYLFINSKVKNSQSVLPFKSTPRREIKDSRPIGSVLTLMNSRSTQTIESAEIESKIETEEMEKEKQITEILPRVEDSQLEPEETYKDWDKLEERVEIGSLYPCDPWLQEKTCGYKYQLDPLDKETEEDREFFEQWQIPSCKDQEESESSSSSADESWDEAIGEDEISSQDLDSGESWEHLDVNEKGEKLEDEKKKEAEDEDEDEDEEETDDDDEDDDENDDEDEGENDDEDEDENEEGDVGENEEDEGESDDENESEEDEDEESDEESDDENEKEENEEKQEGEDWEQVEVSKVPESPKVDKDEKEIVEQLNALKMINVQEEEEEEEKNVEAEIPEELLTQPLGLEELRPLKGNPIFLNVCSEEISNYPFVCDWTKNRIYVASSAEISLLGIGFSGPIEADAEYEVGIRLHTFDGSTATGTTHSMEKTIMAEMGKVFRFMFDKPFAIPASPGKRWERSILVCFWLRGPNTPAFNRNMALDSIFTNRGINIICQWQSNQLAELIYE